MDTSKKLYRLPAEGTFFGVIAGLGRYLEIDATLLRVIVVVLTLMGGWFLVVFYVLAAIFMPLLPSEASVHDTTEKATDTKTPADKKEEDGQKPNAAHASVESLQQEFKEGKVGQNAGNFLGVGLVILGSWFLLNEFYPWLLGDLWKLFWPALLIVIGIVVLVKAGRK